MDKKQWKEGILASWNQRQEAFYSDSEIEIEPLYDFDDLSPNAKEDIGYPGVFPYTRGIYPTMYRGRLWTMRQYSGYSTPEETNRRFKYLLAQGQTGLSVAFDLPTQIGYDSDHIMSSGEVGKVGVSINTLEDMDRLFEGIDLSQISVSMTINATAILLLAFLIALAKRRNIDPKRLRGTIQNDILKEYIARGTYRFPPRPSLRIITDIFAYAKDQLPHFNTISISGYHIREAGATAVEEVAFTLANGIAYVEAALEADLKVDEFAPRLSFFFASYNHFFEEIAKFRAARRMWAKIMKHRFHATNPKAMMLRFHTQTAGSALTATEPENNVIRVTLQALAAVLGGTQSLHTNSQDEALCLPTEHSAKVALRTQQIIAYESGVADTVDPLGGCPYVERLTDQIEEKAQELLQEIEQMGGAIRAIEAGFIQQKIRKSAYRKQMKIESKQQLVVGQNAFVDTSSPLRMETFKIDQKRTKQRVEEIRNYKKNRKKDVSPVLQAVREAAENKNKNLLPPIISAIEEGATLGEIVDVMAAVFGEYRDTHISF
ncbi:MAG: methylmalonyl-CoA mutase [Planctomycetota bacterium]|nr:MAG: methylmalonyl-CoA mutase [Planctomycetota bacterium]